MMFSDCVPRYSGWARQPMSARRQAAWRRRFPSAVSSMPVVALNRLLQRNRQRCLDIELALERVHLESMRTAAPAAETALATPRATARKHRTQDIFKAAAAHAAGAPAA